MNERTQPPENYEREPQPKLHPRIWVGSLADYNAGRLHGDWLDAAVPDDELYESVQRILASSREAGAEEYGIFDYDEFGAFRVGEYERLDVVARIARGIAEHGPAFAAYAELHDGDSDMLSSFEDSYIGEYESAASWAHGVLEDMESIVHQSIPDDLRGYISIDYTSFARDAQLSGRMHFEPTPTGSVYAFAIT